MGQAGCPVADLERDRSASVAFLFFANAFERLVVGFLVDKLAGFGVTFGVVSGYRIFNLRTALYSALSVPFACMLRHRKRHARAFAALFNKDRDGVLRLVGVFAREADEPRVRGATASFGGACL